MSNHGEMLNAECSALLYKSVSFVMPDVWLRLATRNMMSVIAIEGKVVYIMYLMCSKSGTSVVDVASTLVSESGENLSPKYAPDITAPAIHPSENPKA